MLNQQEIEEIRKKLQERGLKPSSLFEEMLDHLACMIEEKMLARVPFPSALEWAFDSLDENNLRKLEKKSRSNIRRVRFHRNLNYWIGSAAASLGLFIVFGGDSNAQSNYLSSPFQVEAARKIKARPCLAHQQAVISPTEAIDYHLSSLAPVQASETGWVRHIYQGGPHQKNYLVIQHTGSHHTLYANLENIKVKVGERVERGEMLGFPAPNQDSSAYLVHFEVYWKGLGSDLILE